MSISLVVKIALVIYSVFAAFSIFLLWRNAAAPDALKNVSIVVVTLLPVLVVVLPYLNPETLESKFNYILLFDSEIKEVTTGQTPNAYSTTYLPMFMNLSEVPDALTAEDFGKLMGPKGLDIIEKGIIEALMARFMSHWDMVQIEEFIGPVFTSRQIQFSSSEEKTELSRQELQKLFKHNQLTSHLGHPRIMLPPSSTLTPTPGPSDNIRIIVIKTSYGDITISITASTGSVAQQGIWGVQAADPQNMNRYSVVHFRVSAQMKLSRTKVYSPKMALYRRWYANLADVLSQFDWSNVNEKVERHLTREAISKSLGSPQ